MKRKNIFKRIVAALCIAACLSFPLSGCSSSGKKGDDYINPPSQSGPDDVYEGEYRISVTSEGGLPINDVRVRAEKNGNVVMSGISSDGNVTFALPQGNYTLTVDESTLPEGYFVPEGTQYVTTPDKATATIVLHSDVISTTAPSSTRYSVGDVIHDFGYNDVEDINTVRTLSQALKNKRAVMLNFFYTTCNPCRQEFPAIEKAYRAYGDKIEIIALTNHEGDDEQKIKLLKEDCGGLSFPMAIDASGITSLFSVSGFPTTVIVDRYGVIAYRSSGTVTSDSAWKALFNRYTADDYTQSAPGADDPVTPGETQKPDPSLKAPTSAEAEAAVLGAGAQGKITDFHPETIENDPDFYEYAWPWMIGSDERGSYLYASNAGANLSYAILYCQVSLSAGDVFSYEYDVNTEDGHDVVYVQINGGMPVAEHSGNSGGWQTQEGIYIADHETVLSFSFTYSKDQLMSEQGEHVRIRNFTVTQIAESDKARDIRVSVVDGLTPQNGKYDLHLIAPGEDGNDSKYYMVEYTDNVGKTRRSYLFADILQSTPWSEKRYGKNFRFEGHSKREDTSLYHLSYWLMSNALDEDKDRLSFTYCSQAMTDLIIENYYLQGFSDNNRVPVTAELKDAIDTFIRAFIRQNPLQIEETVTYYEDMWLELCYYHRHYGAEHATGETCTGLKNSVLGLSRNHAIGIDAKDNVNQHVQITKIISLDGGGLWHAFTPGVTGFYRVWATLDAKYPDVDPMLDIYDGDTHIASANNDLRPDHFLRRDLLCFYTYVKLEAGKAYYLQTHMSYAQETGDYDLHIRYMGTEPIRMLRVCSTGDGAWDGNTGKYLGISVALNPTDNYYHEITRDGEYGSVVYIDFVHPNYYDQANHSIYEMANVGYFDLTKAEFPGKDYTAAVLQYYNRSIAGKSPRDELYGMLPATQELVDILNAVTRQLDGDGPEAFAWLMFANYYHTWA